jgi:hypothetical protein
MVVSPSKDLNSEKMGNMQSRNHCGNLQGTIYDQYADTTSLI